MTFIAMCITLSGVSSSSFFDALAFFMGLIILFGVPATILLIIGYREPREKLEYTRPEIKGTLSFRRHDILKSTNWSRSRFNVLEDYTFYLKIKSWPNYLTIDTLHFLIKSKLEEMGYKIIENV